MANKLFEHFVDHVPLTHLTESIGPVIMRNLNECIIMHELNGEELISTVRFDDMLLLFFKRPYKVTQAQLEKAEKSLPPIDMQDLAKNSLGMKAGKK